MSVQKFKITLNEEKEFIAAEGESIFKAAIRAGITLNHSCLNGRCNTCIVNSEAGETRILNPEVGISTNESINGYILACSRSALSDLRLSVDSYIDKLLEKPKTFPAKVNSYRILAENIVELELRLPPKVSFMFEPGQYVNLIKGAVKRSYSIASASKHDKLLFYIKNYHGGKMSEYLFNSVKVNDLIRIEGPIGTFIYRSNEKRNIVFLATGTGIAPIKSILESLDQNFDDELTDKNIFLFWGNRKSEEFFWEPKFKNLKVHYQPCLSQEISTPVNRIYKIGYIQELLLAESIDLTKSDVYACGSDKMIKSSKILLTKNGLDVRCFYSDSFVVSN